MTGQRIKLRKDFTAHRRDNSRPVKLLKDATGRCDEIVGDTAVVTMDLLERQVCLPVRVIETEDHKEPAIE